MKAPVLHRKEDCGPNPFSVCGAIVLDEALLCWNWWLVSCKRCLQKKPDSEKTQVESESVAVLEAQLEATAQELVARGKMVISGKTKDGRNLYAFVDA